MAAQRRAEPPPDDLRREFRLWPEHVPALQLWGAVQSQWRHGFSGPTGFDWPGLRAHPACLGLPAAQREPVLADLAVMEVAWLAERARLAEEQRRLQQPRTEGPLSD